MLKWLASLVCSSLTFAITDVLCDICIADGVSGDGERHGAWRQRAWRGGEQGAGNRALRQALSHESALWCTLVRLFQTPPHHRTPRAPHAYST